VLVAAGLNSFLQQTAILHKSTLKIVAGWQYMVRDILYVATLRCAMCKEDLNPAPQLWGPGLAP
jgi:hypothetical protein